MPPMETVGLRGHVDDARQTFATRGRLAGLHLVSAAISSALMGPYRGVIPDMATMLLGFWCRVLMLSIAALGGAR